MTACEQNLLSHLNQQSQAAGLDVIHRIECDNLHLYPRYWFNDAQSFTLFKSTPQGIFTSQCQITIDQAAVFGELLCDSPYAVTHLIAGP